MEKQTVQIGKYTFDYWLTHKPIKKIYFRFKKQVFYVSAPYGTNRQEIASLFEKHQDKLLQLASKQQINILDKSNITIVGENYTIIFSDHCRKTETVFFVREQQLLDDVFTLGLPQLQAYVQRRLSMYHDLMAPHLPLPSIGYRRVKHYYGKYQHTKNKITFNPNIMFLEEGLIDYVLVHELAHMQVLNHQKGFYKIVEKILPNYRLLQKKIKKEGINL